MVNAILIMSFTRIITLEVPKGWPLVLIHFTLIEAV